MLKVSYKREDREKVIAEQSKAGLVMVEEWNHVDGDFLFFLPAEEAKPAKKEDPIVELKKRLEAVEEDLSSMKKAVKAG